MILITLKRGLKWIEKLSQQADSGVDICIISEAGKAHYFLHKQINNGDGEPN